MSWWDTNQITSFATAALKTAQKKIDKALDIKADGEENNILLPVPITSDKELPSCETTEKEDNFFSEWGLGGGDDSVSPKASTASKLSTESSIEEDTGIENSGLTGNKTEQPNSANIETAPLHGMLDNAELQCEKTGKLCEDSEFVSTVQVVDDKYGSKGNLLLECDGWHDVDLLPGEDKSTVKAIEQSSTDEKYTKTVTDSSHVFLKTKKKTQRPMKLGPKQTIRKEQPVFDQLTEGKKQEATCSELVDSAGPKCSEMRPEAKKRDDLFSMNAPISFNSNEDTSGHNESGSSTNDSVTRVMSGETIASRSILDIQVTENDIEDSKQTAWGDDIRLSVLAESSTSTGSHQSNSAMEQDRILSSPHCAESGSPDPIVCKTRSHSPDHRTVATEEHIKTVRSPNKLPTDTDLNSCSLEFATDAMPVEANQSVIESSSVHLLSSDEKDYTQVLHVDTMRCIVPVCLGDKEELNTAKPTYNDAGGNKIAEEEWLKSEVSNEESVETSDELSESNKTLTSSDSNRTLEGDSTQLTEKDMGDSCHSKVNAPTESVAAQAVLSSSSYVKTMLEEAMTESLKDTDSPTNSHSSSDMVRVESDHTSGHTSADEIDTTTSSDIEIISHISTPTPNGDYGPANRPFDLSPLRHALSRSVRRGSPPGHKRSDSSSSGTSFRSHNGDELVSPDSYLDKAVNKEKAESSSSECNQTGGNPMEVEKLLKVAPSPPLPPIAENYGSSSELSLQHEKLAEMAEVLDARENKLVELSRENVDLAESNSILRNQLHQSEEARESEQTDLNAVLEEFTKRIRDAEKKNNQIIKEKDLLKKNLQDAEAEIIKKSDNTATLRLMAEKDQQIAELLEEGEKLSKQQLQSNNIIKKLRAKEKESENLLKTINKKLEEQKAENEKLKKVLDNKIDNEKQQAESIQQLNAAVLQQEHEISRTKSELEDYQEKNRSMQVALDNSYKEMAGLHKAKAVRASESQSIALNAETAAKEELRLALEKQQLQTRQEQESLVNQIEDLQLSVRRMEKEHGRREDILRQEISDVQQRLAEAEERNQDLTTSVSTATRPLLRQIENIQSTYTAQTSSYERVEKNLTERLAEAQGQLVAAVEKERAASESLMETTTRITGLESQASSLRQEKSRLQAQLDMERTKTEMLEDAKNNEMAQLETLKRGHEHELSEIRKNKAILENHLEMEKLRVEAEKKKLAMAHDQLKDKENQLMQIQARSVSPLMCSHEGKMSSSTVADSPLTMSGVSLSALSVSQSEDMMENSLMMTSFGSNKMSLYDSLCQSGAATLLENLQSQLKQKEGEIAQLQSEISELEGTREALARELVDITSKNEELECQLEGYPRLEKSYTELDQRYNAILQMYGEKVEEADELRLDLHDVKDMYKGQIEHLLKSIGH